MNRFILLVIFFNVYTSNGYAQQAPAIEFNRAFGGTNYEGITCMAKTSDGGYVVAGGTTSTDGDLLAAGLHGWQGDAMVMKFSAAGILQWTKVYGGGESDGFTSIEQTADGGFIAAGNTNSTDGDVTTGTGGWLVKLNAGGIIQWQAKCANLLQVARQTSDGGYITGGEDIRKFSGTGTLEWTYLTNYIINSLCLAQDGGYVAAGAAATFRGNDFRITKLSSNGMAERLPDYGGFGDDTPYSIHPTTDGGYVVAGRTNSNNNSNVWGNHGGNDIWVIKLDGDLQVQWQKCLGGSGNETGWNIYEGTSRELIIAGESSSANGDLTSNNGSSDGWLVKLSQDGFLLWQQTMGGSEYDSFRGVFQTSDDGYMVAGFSASSDAGISGFHFNPVTVPDAWLVKLGADVSEFLPLSNQSAVRRIDDNLPVSFRDGERRRIATVQANAGNPVRGNVLAEVWAGDPVPGAVSRRYQITPENNAAISSARITLYYLQYEFNEYNQQVSSANRLPSSPTDATGKANFRFIKHSGDLANPGPTVVIDPNDNDIVWNAANEYWEISFDVTSFSTFVAMDAASAAAALPVVFGTIEAFLKNGLLTVNWTTQKEINNAYYLVEASKDGKHFTPVSDKIFSKAREGNSDLLLEYQFSRGNIALQGLAILLLSLSAGFHKRKPLLLLGFIAIGCALFILSCKKNSDEIPDSDDPQLYVRVVQVDKDGVKSYSKIIRAVQQ